MEAFAKMFLLSFSVNGKARFSRGLPFHQPLARLFFLLMVSISSIEAQPAARESDVKATLLFNFSQFVEWPPSSISNTNAPFVIGILGPDPFGRFLDGLIKQERVGGKPIELRRFSRVEESAGAHILYIGRFEPSKLDSIFAALKGRPVLTVRDADDRSPWRGGIIAFVTEKETVRLRVNTGAAQAAGLTISAKLLRLAEIVRDEKP